MNTAEDHEKLRGATQHKERPYESKYAFFCGKQKSHAILRDANYK